MFCSIAHFKVLNKQNYFDGLKLFSDLYPAKFYFSTNLKLFNKSFHVQSIQFLCSIYSTY